MYAILQLGILIVFLFSKYFIIFVDNIDLT